MLFCITESAVGVNRKYRQIAGGTRFLLRQTNALDFTCHQPDNSSPGEGAYECRVTILPDETHSLMRVVIVDGCPHRVSLADGQPEMNFVQFAKHEHFVFCLNGPFLPEPEKSAIQQRLFALPETRIEAA
jgi:hypothetical protein